jgi:AraC-like DNA-binding protein
LEVGYDNFSHFTRMFRQHAGMTPVEYRRQRQGEDRA